MKLSNVYNIGGVTKTGEYKNGLKNQRTAFGFQFLVLSFVIDKLHTRLQKPTTNHQ